MWNVRPRFLAWLLFALACFLPACLFHDPIAAELQIECGAPPLLHSKAWRKLGPTGRDYLCRVLAHDALVRRRERAMVLLLRYDDVPALMAVIFAASDASLAHLHDWAIKTLLQADPKRVGATFDQIEDAQLVRLLRDPLTPGMNPIVLAHIFARARPERCKRLERELRYGSDGDVRFRLADGLYWWAECERQEREFHHR